ncbi:MAG: acylphosphatase [Nitrososphaerales archaeon]
MKRVIVVAKGDVQRVGYRDEVERNARKLGITGYVENIKPYDVKIVAEGDEERLKQFIENIKIQRYPIYVESLEVNWENATGEYKYFEIKRGEWQEELFERIDVAGKLLHKSVELGERSVQLSERSVELGERSVQLGERSVQLGERSVQLSERSVQLSERSVQLGERSVQLGEMNLELGKRSVSIGEEMLKVIKEESEKTRKAVREESRMTRREIRLLRGDIRMYLEESLKEIRTKILEIEKALKKAGIM